MDLYSLKRPLDGQKILPRPLDGQKILLRNSTLSKDRSMALCILRVVCLAWLREQGGRQSRLYLLILSTVPQRKTYRLLGYSVARWTENTAQRLLYSLKDQRLLVRWFE
jgi:hypothetical protein